MPMSEQVCPGKSQLNAFSGVKSASEKNPSLMGLLLKSGFKIWFVKYILLRNNAEKPSASDLLILCFIPVSGGTGGGPGLCGHQEAAPVTPVPGLSTTVKVAYPRRFWTNRESQQSTEIVSTWTHLHTRAFSVKRCQSSDAQRIENHRAEHRVLNPSGPRTPGCSWNASADSGHG